MGYYYNQEKANFFVSANNIGRLKALLKIHQNHRWDFDFDNDGNCINISLNGETKDYQEEVLEAIAPLVKNGSYIEITGEDTYDIFRLVFIDGKVKTIKAKITFDGMED